MTIGQGGYMLENKCEKNVVCDICKINRDDYNGTKWATKTGFICDKCLTEKQQRAIDAFSKEDSGGHYFMNRDDIKCPYCGYEYTPNGLYESTDSEECGTCGSVMSVDVEYTASYSITKTRF